MLSFLLTLIFIRTFTASLAFPVFNFFFSIFMLGFTIFWVIYRKPATEILSPLKWPLILFCVSLAISVIFSLNIPVSLEQLYKYFTGLLLFFIGSTLLPEEKERAMLYLVVMAIIISLLDFYQYLFGFKHTMEYLVRNKISDVFTVDYISRKRVFLPFFNPNTLAGFLAMLMPLALLFKKRVWLMIIIAIALLLTKSLTAIFGLFLALLVYFYIKGELNNRILLTLGGIILAIVVFILVRGASGNLYFTPLFSSAMRLNYWWDTLIIIGAFPFTGVGLGNFSLVPTRYAHNSYLQIWAEMGILGLVSFLWFIYLVFKLSLKDAQSSPQKEQIAILACATSSFLIINLLDFSFFLPEASLTWWLLLGSLFSFFNKPAV